MSEQVGCLALGPGADVGRLLLGQLQQLGGVAAERGVARASDRLDLLLELGDLGRERRALRAELGDLVAGACQLGFLIARPGVDGVRVVTAATGQRERRRSLGGVEDGLSGLVGHRGSPFVSMLEVRGPPYLRTVTAKTAVRGPNAQMPRNRLIASMCWARNSSSRTPRPSSGASASTPTLPWCLLWCTSSAAWPTSSSL